MAFVQIAATQSYSYPVSGGSVPFTYTLEQDGGTLNTTRPLNVVRGVIKRVGDEGAGVFDPILAGQLVMRVQDGSRTLATIFDGVDHLSDFRITATRNGNAWFKGPLLEVTGGDRPLQDYQSLELVFSCGISELAKLSWEDELSDLESQFSSSYPYVTVAELVGYIMNQTPTELNTRVYWSFGHDGYYTTDGAAMAHRERVDGLCRDLDKPTLLDVLERLADKYNAQVLQSGGLWRFMQRSARLGIIAGLSSEYAQVTTSGVTSDGSEDLWRTVIDVADGGSHPFQRRQHLAVAGVKSTHSFAQRPATGGDFNDLYDAGAGIWDGWEESGNVTVNSTLPTITAANAAAAKLTQVFEIPAYYHYGAGDIITIALHAVVDGSGVTFNGAMKLGRVWLTYEDGTTVRYARADGTWASSAVNFDGTVDLNVGNSYQDEVGTTGAPLSVTMDPVPLASGRVAKLTVEMSMDPSPGGSSEIAQVDWHVFEVTVEATGPVATSRTYSIGEGAPDEPGQLFTSGDFERYNPVVGNMQYTADGSAWQDTDDWGSGKSFHTVRLEDRFQQVNTRLEGYEMTLPLLLEDREIHHTIQYDSVGYAAVCSHEQDYPFARKLVMYPIKTETVPAVTSEYTYEKS